MKKTYSIVTPAKGRKFSLIAIPICFVIVISQLQAYGQNPAKVYSLFLYGFAKNVKWPESKTTGDFIIGVIDSPDLAAELKTLATQRIVGSQKILVKEYQNIEEVGECHILFLSTFRSSLLASITARWPANSILIVSEGEGLTKKGSCLNFIEVQGKLRFEINENALQARDIKIPANLRSMGIVVN